MGILYKGIYANFKCAAWEFSSKQGLLRPMGSYDGVSYLLSSRCLPVCLGFKGLELAMKLGLVPGNGYVIYRI